VKSIGKKIGNSVKTMKDKASVAIDKFADSAKTRPEKADWVLQNARDDYSKVKLDNNGQVLPDEASQKFDRFVILCFTNKYSNGKLITMTPTYNNPDLVLGEKAQEKDNYKAADDIAQGWTKRSGNGPAFIYMAKGKDDKEAAFLCAYFKGELKADQLEKYFQLVRRDLEGAAQMAAGEFDNSDDTPAADPKGQDQQQATDNDGNTTNGTTENGEAEQQAATTAESLNTIMSNLTDLHEASLEDHIADSLVEAYNNVAGFKLTNSSYLDNKFTVDGTIYFTSGNRRATTYTFTEALATGNKVILVGINEKLGPSSRFTIKGNTKNNTLITESFSKTR
jgi:hypothetical protein